MTKPDLVVIIAQNQSNNVNKSECLFLNIFELSRQPVRDMIDFRRKTIFPILILFVLCKYKFRIINATLQYINFRLHIIGTIRLF